MSLYVTRGGDMLDAILFKAYGHHGGGMLAACLTLNPGLCQQPPVLPAGMVILLPDPLPTAPKKEVHLWD